MKSIIILVLILVIILAVYILIFLAKKKAKEQYEKCDDVVVKVALTEIHDKYFMDLETFVKNAKLVDAETVNPAETEIE